MTCFQPRSLFLLQNEKKIKDDERGMDPFRRNRKVEVYGSKEPFWATETLNLHEVPS